MSLYITKLLFCFTIHEFFDCTLHLLWEIFIINIDIQFKYWFIINGTKVNNNHVVYDCICFNVHKVLFFTSQHFIRHTI